jgi:hypothetical protein
MHVTAVLPLAVGGRAFEDMDSTVVYIFNTGEAVEKDVYRRGPFFFKAI